MYPGRQFKDASGQVREAASVWSHESLHQHSPIADLLDVKRRAPPKLIRTRRLANGEIIRTRAGPDVEARAMALKAEREEAMLIKRGAIEPAPRPFPKTTDRALYGGPCLPADMHPTGPWHGQLNRTTAQRVQAPQSSEHKDDQQLRVAYGRRDSFAFSDTEVFSARPSSLKAKPSRGRSSSEFSSGLNQGHHRQVEYGRSQQRLSQLPQIRSTPRGKQQPEPEHIRPYDSAFLGQSPTSPKNAQVGQRMSQAIQGKFNCARSMACRLMLPMHSRQHFAISHSFDTPIWQDTATLLRRRAIRSVQRIGSREQAIVAVYLNTGMRTDSIAMIPP